MTNALSNRMKEYENVSRIYLPRRMPVIIRVDGRAFHTLTRGFDRPFDEVLHEVMCATANLLCQGIEGVKLAYTQSDEISLLITNDDSIDTAVHVFEHVIGSRRARLSRQVGTRRRYRSARCPDEPSGRRV